MASVSPYHVLLSIHAAPQYLLQVGDGHAVALQLLVRSRLHVVANVDHRLDQIERLLDELE